MSDKNKPTPETESETEPGTEPEANTLTQTLTEELILGHFDNRLTDQQESELAHKLATCPETRARFRTQMRMEGRLHSLGRDGFLAPAAAQQDPVETDSEAHSERQEPTIAASSPPRRTLTVATSWVVAASTILLLTTWSLWPSGVDAASVLQQAKMAALESVDRTYRVTISNPNDEDLKQELTLVIRCEKKGKPKFLIRPADDSYIMGSDGSEFWMARSGGSVLVTSNYRTLPLVLRRRIPNRRILGLATSPNEPLLLDINELLLLIERKYEIELVDEQGSSEYHIRATVRSKKLNVPKTIEFWADADTGVVVKALTHWDDQNSRMLELLNTDSLSNTWYQYPRHAPNAEVLRL